MGGGCGAGQWACLPVVWCSGACAWQVGGGGGEAGPPPQKKKKKNKKVVTLFGRLYYHVWCEKSEHAGVGYYTSGTTTHPVSVSTIRPINVTTHQQNGNTNFTRKAKSGWYTQCGHQWAQGRLEWAVGRRRKSGWALHTTGLVGRIIYTTNPIQSSYNVQCCVHTYYYS